MEIEYLSKFKVEEGNYISKVYTFNPPKVCFKLRKERLYTLIMMDPDAEDGNKIHWLITNFTSDFAKKPGNTILPYVGPHPPKTTGEHRYYFLLIKQKKPTKVVPLNAQNRLIALQDLFQILDLDGTIVERKFFKSHA